MRCEWKEVRLEDVISKLGDGLHGTPKYDKNGEYFFINGNNLDNGKITINEQTKRVNKEQYLKIKKELNNRTILVSINGTLGNVALYQGEKVCLGKSACYFNVDENTCKQYIRYVMTSNLFQHYILVYATGTTIKNMGLKAMRDFTFKLPPLPTQKKIAHILSTLDDKIELNRKINKTLEAMAQALFQSWFVDFDPVHAKAGCKSEADLTNAAKALGISKEILELFPSEFEKSEMGMIPKGWRISRIGDKLDVLLGGTPSRSNDSYWKNGTIAWINSGKVNEFRITKASEMITEEAVQKSSTKLLPKKTTVLAITGATLGQVSLLEIDSCANQSVIGLPETEELNHSFIYPCICNAILELMSHQTGGAQQHINKGNVENYSIVIPSLELLNAYVLLAQPIMKKISINSFEIQTLQKTRDTLLPKLLSGELDVSEIKLDI